MSINDPLIELIFVNSTNKSPK